MAKYVRKKIGDILVESGDISPEQLEEALAVQKEKKDRLGNVLIDMGYISERKLIEVLEEQLGIPHVDLYDKSIDPEIATCLNKSLAQRHKVIPIDRRNDRLILAMHDPMDVIAIDDVSLATGLEVSPVIASKDAINYALNQHYELIETLDESTAEQKQQAEKKEKEAEENKVEDAPVVKVVNSLIQRAASEGASDIHIEPVGNHVRVRMRIDGVLHDIMAPPKDTQALLASRIKIMSGMDIAEKRLPQDGGFQERMGSKVINIRVSTLPTIYGEKVVMRLLEREKVVRAMDKLGFSEYNYRTIIDLLKSDAGMLLVTGPTGSGKTTTLYSALNYLNTVDQNIITVEDPVEYQLAGINQTNVKPNIGLTFANALRSILRQDPNIIMVGEIRDLETAEIATRSALTGHLVLSTLHTNDACATINRLLDMGVASHLLTPSLVGVMAQRLVRLNCPRCTEEYEASEEERILIKRMSRMEPPEKLYLGAGCKNCNHTGFRGRTGIHELLAVTHEIRNLILHGASTDELREKALEQGMVSMVDDGLMRVKNGTVALQELMRVVYTI